MRKALNEPGFWLMVFGTVIIAMVLFAPDGRCESPNKMTTVAHDYGPLTYIVAFDNSLSFREIKYYHLIGPTGKEGVLVGITHSVPTMKVLQLMLRRYLLTIMDGGM